MNKHTVTFDGATFKRTSANRIYSHAVIVTTLIADRMADAEQGGRADYKMNFKFYAQLADGTSEFLARNGNQFPRGKDDDRIQEAQAWLDRGEQGEIDRHVRAEQDYIAKAPKTADGLSVITCAGWCGRYDLAQKLAGSVKHGTPHIVETEVKG